MISVFRVFTAICIAILAIASGEAQAQPGGRPGGPGVIGGPGGVDVELVKSCDCKPAGRDGVEVLVVPVGEIELLASRAQKLALKMSLAFLLRACLIRAFCEPSF